MASEKPTLFPQLNGTPGDAPQSEDITDMPLRPLNAGQKDWPDSFATGENVSSIHSEGAFGEQPEQVGPKEETTERQEKKSRRSAGERIAQLTRRYRQEESRAHGLTEALAARDERIEALERRLEERQSYKPPATEPYYAAPEGQDPQGPQPANIAHIVNDAVRRAVDPIVRDTKAEREQRALKDEQQVSYMDACREVPELADPQSSESEAFREIWSQSPLRVDPDGPLHVAYMVKGAFAEERQTRPAREARKRAASVVTPGPRTTDITTSAPKSGHMKNVMSEGLDRFRGGDKDPETYIAIRKAQRRLQGR